jgi:ABC-type phosphate transport system substrate-binding protein
MRAFVLFVLALLLALTAVAPTLAADEPPAPPYRVIVHPTNPVSSVDRQFLADAFLKKVKRWPGDEVIRPADLLLRDATRKEFTKRVLSRSIDAVKAYWQQQIFSGRDVPPPEFEDQAKVIAYVLKHPGAVGYISGTGSLAGAKVVRVGR